MRGAGSLLILEGGYPPPCSPVFRALHKRSRRIAYAGYGSGQLSDRGVPHPSCSGSHPPPPPAQKKEEGGGGVPSPTSKVSNPVFCAAVIASFRVQFSSGRPSPPTFSQMSWGGIPTPLSKGGVATLPPYPCHPPPPLRKFLWWGGGGYPPLRDWTVRMTHSGQEDYASAIRPGHVLIRMTNSSAFKKRVMTGAGRSMGHNYASSNIFTATGIISGRLSVMK